MAEPQAMPAPNAHKIAVEGVLILPVSRASASAIGTDAADVLPYLSISTIT